MTKKISKVAPSGDRLKTLETLRDVIAETIDGTNSARDIAALSRQMTEVLAEIDEIKKAEGADQISTIDEIRNRFRVAK